MYLIGKDVLEIENRPTLYGVPFLVWHGSWTPVGCSVEHARRVTGVPYLSLDEFSVLKQNVVAKGNVPEVVSVRGNIHPIEKLADLYVPYSFSVGHELDIREGLVVRTLDDYTDVVERVLPQVKTLRRQRGDKIKHDRRLHNRVLAFAQLYHPSEFNRYEPVIL
ncbi:hypothetical protein HZB00_02705 [Candidatus Woesearchaeota archaeon]|nr:hypothetical protein [Candidatus Woesearchaeota archaeon]